MEPNALPTLSAAAQRRRAIGYNPSRAARRLTRDERPVYSVFDYNAEILHETELKDEQACKAYVRNGHITWLNVDGLIRKDIEALCRHYGVPRPRVAETRRGAATRLPLRRVFRGQNNSQRRR